MATHVPGSHRREQFEIALREHRRGLYAAAMRMCRSAAEAEDLVQETVMKAWRGWDRFEQGTHARAWMQRILFNTFVSRRRRRLRERQLLDQVFRHGLEALPVHIEPSIVRESLSDELASGLEALPESLRHVMLLVDADGYSYREAAERLGCPIGTVMSRLHRARRTLRASLTVEPLAA